MILGCDAAGLDEDGNEVVVHAVISDPAGPATRRWTRGRSLLSERHQGTFADQVVVPRGNVVPKPASLSLRGGGLPADRLAHGVPDALHPGRPQARRHGAGAGRRRRRRDRADHARPRRRPEGARHQPRRGQAARALEIGAHEVFESGARLPVKVDAVMETVGRATWSHSIRSLRPGGRIVISGTTSGPKLDDAELTRIFFLQLSVIGSTMGTRAELASLVNLLDATGTRPLVDRALPMERGPRRLRRDGRGRRLRQDRLHPVRAGRGTASWHLLTGAGSGIGLVLAHRLAERGDDLVLLARSEARAERARAELPDASSLVADLADPGTINGLGRQVDGRRGLAGARGRRRRPRAGRRAAARRQWEEQLAVNLTAPAVLTRELLPAPARRPAARSSSSTPPRGSRPAPSGRRTPPRSSACGPSPTRCAPRRSSTASG